MSEPRIEGRYAELVESFVAYKRSIGYGYPESTMHLVALMARFLDAHPDDRIVTEEIADAFARSGRPGEAASTQNKRASMIRQFALYLQRLGHDCFVPDMERNRVRAKSPFAPRIITEAEMAAVIGIADEAPIRRLHPETAPAYRLLLRLLWCCGLRLSEALTLRVEDVDLQSATITVHRAKYNRTRLLPLSGELAGYIGGYLGAMGMRDGAQWLFPNAGGGHIARGVAAPQIKKMMLMAGVTRPDGTSPRVHDVRHSYAIAALAKMDAEGVEARCALPLLCAYMGHSDIVSTEYYLRLTEERHSEIHGKMAGLSDDVFGEVM